MKILQCRNKIFSFFFIILLIVTLPLRYTVYTGHLMDDNMDELRDRTQCLVSVALGHRLAICHSQLPLLPNESPKLVHWQVSYKPLPVFFSLLTLLEFT